MSNKINFDTLILEKRIEKNAELLICIPTFKSYEITKQTVLSFLNQEDVHFDILISGVSGDIELLAKDFPNINYIITKDNYGSSGNQILNIFISKKYNYKFVMLNDNDSRFEKYDSLKKMIHNMLDNDLLVTFPLHENLEIKFEDIEPFKDYFFPFHCCLYSIEVFRDSEYYFDFNYFLCFDDVALIIYLKRFKNRISCSEVIYSHPEKPGKFFNYNFQFYFTRSYFNFMFHEKVPILDKIYWLFFYPPHFLIPGYILYSLVNKDLEYFKILFIAFSQALFKRYKLINFKHPKYVYEEFFGNVEAPIFKRFNCRTDIIFPKKYVFIDEGKYKKRYFLLKD